MAAACSSSDDSGSPPSAPTTAAGAGAIDCEAAADDAIGPLQAFIDEYDDLTPEEWNALDPPADAMPAQDELIAIAQAAVDEGCEPGRMEELLAERIAGLSGQGEVGRAVAAALRGDGPILGPPIPPPPETIQREEEPSTRVVTPDDELDLILATIAPGSTIRFEAGTYHYDEPLVVNVDVTFVGAGAGDTIISSSAEGVAVTFVGPGGFVVEDLTIEHVGELEASVLLAIEGPLRVTRSVLRGGVAGSEASGGGHGLVFAWAQLAGFPERTEDERAGALVIEDTEIVDNEAAGILMSGTAAPDIERSTIANNGGCGVCYTGESGGSIRNSSIIGNQIGIQVGDDARPVIETVAITDNVAAGISIDGSGTTVVADSQLERNTGVGVQITGGAVARLERTVVTDQGVGVLAAGTSTVTVLDNTFTTHDIAVQVGVDADVDTTGNTITASVSAGVSYGDDSTGTIAANQITDAPEAAIQVIGRATPEVRNNTISTAGGVGISVVEDSVVTVAENVVSQRDVGIQVGGTAVSEVTDNVVTDSVAVGILFGERSSGVVRANEVSSPEAVGILAGGESTPWIEANQLLGNGVGLVFREEAGGDARDNLIRSQTIAVQVVDSASPFVFSNDIEESSEAGIAIAGTSTVRIEQNRFVRNGNISIQVAESARPDIAGNVIDGQAVYGILYRDDGGGRARDNRVISHVYGIQLDGTASPSITGNSLEEIALTSIVYSGSSGGDASGNRCTESFSAGISISDDADPELGTNECSVSRAS